METTSESATPTRAVRAAVVSLPTSLMLAVGCWGLDRGSMWLDEAATFTVASRSVRQILAVLDHIDVVHGAYYLAQHLWLGLGDGEVWLRVPSVVGMAVAAGATATLGLRLANARTGLVAGLLFAGWPLVSYYAQEARSFALVTGAVLVATVCLVRALGGGRARWWWGYAVAVAVAVTLNELAALAVAAHGVTVVLVRPAWRVWRWWLVSALACGAVTARVGLASLEQSDQVGHTPPVSWTTLAALAERFVGAGPGQIALVAGLALAGLLGGVVRPTGRPLLVVVLPLLLVPVGMLLLVSTVQPLLEARYVLASVAGLPLLAASGVDRLAGRAARVAGRPAAGSAVAALLVAAVWLVQLPDLRHERTVDSRSQDFAAAAAVVRAEAQPGDAVLFVPLSYRLGAMAYPDGYVQVDDIALRRSAMEAANLRGTNRPLHEIQAAMLGRRRIWVVGTSGLRVRATDRVGTAELVVLGQHFVRERRFPAPGAMMRSLEVDLFVRSG